MSATALTRSGGGSTLAGAGAPTPGTVGAAAERFARLTLAQAPQTQRTYRGALDRFATWLAAYNAQRYGLAVTDQAQAPVEAITADAIADYLLHLEDRGLSVSTIKKDRAAINRFVRYLHTLRVIDATEILMIEGPRMHRGASARPALDEASWRRVQAVARARLQPDARQRSTPTLAARDHAVLMLLGACGLRNEEVRTLPVDAVFVRRSDGNRAWLAVTGKGRREREFPLTADVVDALHRWEQARPPEIADHPLMFPRLGRADATGLHARAATVPPTNTDAGRISSEALRKIVAPVMKTAGVPDQLAHPHVLRHTFATLYMRRPGARLEHLQALMGHASIKTTADYVHVVAEELEADVDARDRGLSALERDRRRRGRH